MKRYLCIILVQAIIFLWVVVSAVTGADVSNHNGGMGENAARDFAGLNDTLDKTLGNCTWIWGGDNPRPINEFRLFRREFVLDYKSTNAEVWAFAEFRYKMFINGQFVATGPMPCQPDHRLVDRYAISKYLKAGRNSIAFIVHCPGIMTGQWTLCDAALMCAIRVDGKEVLRTDSSWRTTRCDAWHKPTELCGFGKGWQEWCVMREIPNGWMETGFNDERWESAIILPYLSGGSARELVENYVGYPTLRQYSALRLVNSGLTDNLVPGVMTSLPYFSGGSARELGEAMRKNYTENWNRWEKMFGRWNINTDQPLDSDIKVPEPIALRAFMEKHVDANGAFEIKTNLTVENIFPIIINDNTAALQEIKANSKYVLLDLGVVRSGFICLTIRSASGGTVDIAYDDRLQPEGRIYPFRATPNCERVEMPAGEASWTGFFERGLRYMQITFRDFHGDIKIENAGVIETLTVGQDRPNAEFSTNDKTLNKIWKAAKETVRLYCNGCGAGDPTRERVHWFHDDTMALRMAFYCFGEWRNWRRALELTAQSQNADGSFPVISPGQFEDWNMVTGSCYWVTAVEEYVSTTGDEAFGKQMLEHVKRHIEFQKRFINGDGLLYETPGRRFLSWADGVPRTPYKPGETWAKQTRASWGDFFDPPTRGYNAIINTYWIWSLNSAAKLAQRLENTELSLAWTELAEHARTAYEKRFWDNSAGLYRDNVCFDANGTINKPTFCESTLFLMMRAGILEQTKGLKCVDRIFEPNFVCNRTSGGLDLSALPIFLIKAGRMRDALDIYLDRWGQPILAGATTCGEEFFRDTGNSDCHIHGATPARDFIEFVAGIKISGPMWSAVRFEPQSDAPDLKCSVPTPRGTISVEIQTRSDKKRMLSYSVPDGCKATRIVDGKEMALSQSGIFQID
ncbi:MAG: hypothetical protein A2Y13_10535 [Planctomycetes bacterium GWC2_45_44]|nr:MAG: hypothetical protein A2Y13_10535 [Planctomycetes bacterium GWC2_45_44]